MVLFDFVFKYCFSKKSLIILFFLMGLLCFLYALSIYNINEYLSYEEVIYSYSLNSVYYTKTIITFFSCYLFLFCLNNKCLSAVNFITSSGKTKEKYIQCFIINNLFIVLSCLTICLIFFLIIGIIFKSFFFVNVEVLKCFLDIYFLAIYYGLLSMLFKQLFKNQMSLMLVFVMFMISEEILIEDNILINIFKFFCPNFRDINSFNVIQLIGIIALNIFLVVINCIFFKKIDINQ